MQLSVVVPTLNGREELRGCLDALAERVPDAEVVVVNGPSADGTTGMVRDRPDVDVLVEIADRTINAARNAGINRATGDAVALLDRTFSVEDGWFDAVVEGLAEAPVVTGPTHQELTAGMTTESEETTTIAGREVTYFNPGNVTFTTEILDEFDGFDEYLEIGGSRDLAHRIAGADYDVAWQSSMCVRREFEADGGMRRTDWTAKYQSLTYRLVKNYGMGVRIGARVVRHAVGDALSVGGDVARGNAKLTEWSAAGAAVVPNIWRGSQDGLSARMGDRSPRRNPNGVSARMDRAVARYDR